MPLFEWNKTLAAAIANAISLPHITPETIEEELSVPPTVSAGHTAFPCFRLAKSLKKSPDQIASQIKTQLQIKGVSISTAGAYLNFRWEPALLYQKTIRTIFDKGERYGSDTFGKGKSVLIEFCSPNIAKKLAFHHIRSTLIGNVLSNVYDFLGFQCERMNFVGDWGSQFARLLAAVELWGEASLLSEKKVSESMEHLSDVYVRFHQDLENHPERLELAARCLKQLEEADPKIVNQWKSIREISLKAMQRTLDRMNIHIQHVEGESAYIPQIQNVLKEIKEKAQARLSEGAWIVEVPGIETPALIQKKDGTTLYLTRDIAAARDRFERFNFEKMLYVVSEQQKLHFQLVFGVLKQMGIVWSDRLEHVSFGTVLFGSEKMSTREGRVILLEELLNEAKRLALVECTQKNPNLKNKEDIAEKIGLGAIIYGDLASNRTRSIEFDWKQMLALDGETGPYLQYAVVRCNSLLEKAKDFLDLSVSETSYSFSVEEEALLLTLAKFRSVLHRVLRDSEPAHLAGYLMDLAKAFSRFYYRFPVLQANEPSERTVRLHLVAATRQVLQNGLSLLGIPCPQEM